MLLPIQNIYINAILLPFEPENIHSETMEALSAAIKPNTHVISNNILPLNAIHRSIVIF